MKSQHRHELQTNELGRIADRVAAASTDFYALHGKSVLYGICFVAIAAALLIVLTKRNHQAEASAWRDLAAAINPEDLAMVAETHPGTSAGRWAKVREGELRLNEGIQLAFTNFESAEKELKLSRKALQAVVDERGAPPEIRERALYSLALCLESQSDGSESEAIKTYEALLREFPASIYKTEAERRMAALAAGSGQAFYAWFSKYDRPKVVERGPRDRAVDDPERALLDSLDLPLDGDLKPLEGDAAAKPDKEAGAGQDKPEEAKKPSLELPEPAKKAEDPPADKPAP